MITVSEIESHGTHYEVADNSGRVIVTYPHLETAVIAAVVLAKANRDNVVIQTIEWYEKEND